MKKTMEIETMTILTPDDRDVRRRTTGMSGWGQQGCEEEDNRDVRRRTTGMSGGGQQGCEEEDNRDVRRRTTGT